MPTATEREAPPVRRIAVGVKPDLPDPMGERIRVQLADDLDIHVDRVQVIDVYTVCARLDEDEWERIRTELFTDPIVQHSAFDSCLPETFDCLVEVGFLPGVTDNVGKSSAMGIADVLGRALDDDEAVYKSTQYAMSGVTPEQCDGIARDLLANELIERWTLRTGDELRADPALPLLEVPVVTDRSDTVVHEIDLDISDDALLALSRENTYALELKELKAIQGYYADEQVQRARVSLGLTAKPTDIELEILAQTWSEHCKHKIFSALIEYTDPDGKMHTIDGLFKSFVKATTDDVAKRVDWLVSVFDDNAGIIRFDENWNFALKAETHNSPSALDPYGGAMTGIVGCNRDIMGAGMACRCIFNTDVFCVGPPDYDGPIPKRLFHPRRVLRGVHRGVKDGGNQSGIPDVNGAIVFHERFLGKPLVFCGTGGLIPVTVNGKPSHEKAARPGDLIVMVGGRIGKDGIHGATFSSEELHEGSPATAVQIGDPITQKNMADFILEARDRGLFTSITDNGAGGLSSSVGEMARDPGGCEVHLDRAPLKYAGLAPWEIFLSEAQERMTLAVAPETLSDLKDLAHRREVEVTVLGNFTDSGRLECWYEGARIAALDMDFLHNGVPRMRLRAELSQPACDDHIVVEDSDLTRALKDVLAMPNVCSKEAFVRMYDHEVQGQSVLKQFQGLHQDGPGDAAVLRPVPGSTKGLAVSCGICPKYSDLDTYRMMAAAVDEAVRNLVCVGGALGTIAGLDNFCWPDPVESDKTPDGRHKLAQLVRCCQALYDVCTAYDIPLISGKDSMKNDYKIGDIKISIPPTVLFTAVAVVDDVTKAVSMDVKRPGDLVFVVGDTRDEMGGSEYLALKGRLGTNAPSVDPVQARASYEKLGDAIQRGLVASCHDCSDGGLAVALAESAFAGGYGMDLDIASLGLDNDTVALFSETQSRFVVSCTPADAPAFQDAMRGTPCHQLGDVGSGDGFTVRNGDSFLIDTTIDELKDAWKRTLNW
ncbi:MAG: phosphoribosylformylglycinamidine synthase subunit PurL [Candidatus Hydrogenedentes bacterium]|nr:phosphoribosylformylglycinamidine synthase subunit PurL [Candidatus Hydrogenedentota bacterium]